MISITNWNILIDYFKETDTIRSTQDNQNYGWVIWKLLINRLADWSGNPFFLSLKKKDCNKAEITKIKQMKRRDFYKKLP
jgi:hypothetical protein